METCGRLAVLLSGGGARVSSNLKGYKVDLRSLKSPTDASVLVINVRRGASRDPLDHLELVGSLASAGISALAATLVVRLAWRMEIRVCVCVCVCVQFEGELCLSGTLGMANLVQDTLFHSLRRCQD